MEQAVTLIILLLVIGAVGAFVSGLVGIGGAIIIFPMLLFIPPLFGIETITPHLASGLTAAQVFFSTLSGSISQHHNPAVNRRLIIPMGSGILVGSLAGAYSASLFDASIINIVYTGLAILAVMLMFVKVRPEHTKEHFNPVLLFITAVMIGVLSGIVGAGGAFIIVPVLLALFKAPFRSVVASSIFIAFISSIGTFIMKSVTGDVDFMLMIPLVVTSLIMAPIGTKVSKATNQSVLRYILAALIAAAAVKMLLEIM
ncbi:sulfite exporter TauE/SafE family protein [Macrococcus carouselicus]|uniref:Probable membrane transporter protein n=1 Tax=Macrococcus carouselicus TaxID=69969 RepID=A0A9Q8CLP9_9STAP|nr:sulfite exporter TauE/SafE family protein [Macrococcus carouselicus]TDM02273.1 sulfite exporter TauE/SafE family protein [Macrococcus carouselicus]